MERAHMEDMMIEANDLISQNRISEAFEKLEAIVREAPDFGKAHNHLGWIYETKYADYEKAEHHYKLALQYSPYYVATYYNYAIILSTLKKWDDLKQLLDSAMKVPGINPGTINNEYAIMYESQGKFREAIVAYKHYVLDLYDNDKIEVVASAIARCKRKMEILGEDNHQGVPGPKDF